MQIICNFLFMQTKKVIIVIGLLPAKVVQIFYLRLKYIPSLKDLLLPEAVEGIFLAHFIQMSNQTNIVNSKVC